MGENRLEELQYPIGKFTRPGQLDAAERDRLIAGLAAFPARLRETVAGLGEEQLAAPYRPGGWTVRQVVHHLADAMMNTYMRVKLALTEDRPAICPFDEAKWAELPDSSVYGVEDSLALLEALHQRWDRLWRSLGAEQFRREFVHPANGPWTLDDALAFADWHARHHTAQIASLRRRMGW
jgi:uncharacterized damage-inducible protein DinB